MNNRLLGYKVLICYTIINVQRAKIRYKYTIMSVSIQTNH